MRRIGLLGGMSWESTVPYYRIVNRVVGERLGGLHSAEIVLVSVDFHEIETLQHADRWDEAGARLADAARRVEAGGAELLALCTNTMHRVADAIEAAVTIPLLHIADATADAIADAGVDRIGLLGTRFTMEQAFYRDRLAGRHGLEVATPAERDREIVHSIIYDELCLGRIEEGSRRELVRIVDALVEQGAGGVVLGCTELGLLLDPASANVPLYDTAEIHAEAAARMALED